MIIKKIFSNIKWILRFAPKKDYLIWPILNTFLTIGNILITSVISSYVVFTFSRTIVYFRLGILLFLCICVGLMAWLKNCFNTNMFWKNIYLRMTVTARDALSFLSEPYELSLNEPRQEMRQASIHYGFEDDNSGVAMFFPELVEMLSNLVSLIMISLLTTTVSIIFPLVIIVSIITSFYLMAKYTYIRDSLNRSMQGLYIENDYYKRLAFSDDASQIIRLYNYSETIKKAIQNSSNKIEKLENKILKKRLANTVILQIITLIRMVIIYGTLIWLALTHKINIINFTFYFTVCSNIEILANGLWKDTRLFLSANDDLTIGRKYIDQSKKYVIKNKNIKSRDSNSISIEFLHVYFKYPNATNYAIKDVCLKIKKGGHLALIGLNGSGKSTLMLLLMGYLTPTKGKILINGQVKSNNERMKYFSTMFQDNTVLATTIRNNVTVFKPFLKKRTEAIYRKIGLNTIFKNSVTENSMLTKYINSNGIELSGGETELLMLGRMLYQTAGCYVLDEPSASLDAIKEKELYKLIKKLTHKKTVIFISHRLASVSLSDNICLLSKGKISAYGQHEALLKESKEYKEMYESQARYYNGKIITNDNQNT